MKEIKRSKGTKKIDSIEASNSGWKDLSEGWYEVGQKNETPLLPRKIKVTMKFGFPNLVSFSAAIESPITFPKEQPCPRSMS